MLYRVHLAKMGIELTTLVVIGTDCTGSYKSNYHTITTTTVTVGKHVNIVLIKYWTICLCPLRTNYFRKPKRMSYYPIIWRAYWATICTWFLDFVIVISFSTYDRDWITNELSKNYHLSGVGVCRTARMGKETSFMSELDSEGGWKVIGVDRAVGIHVVYPYNTSWLTVQVLFPG